MAISGLSCTSFSMRGSSIVIANCGTVFMMFYRYDLVHDPWRVPCDVRCLPFVLPRIIILSTSRSLCMEYRITFEVCLLMTWILLHRGNKFHIPRTWLRNSKFGSNWPLKNWDFRSLRHYVISDERWLQICKSLVRMGNVLQNFVITSTLMANMMCVTIVDDF